MNAPAAAFMLAPDATAALRIVAGLVPAALLTWLLLLTYRWIRSRSLILGRMFAAGLVVRAAVGVALFVISFFGLALFRRLQLGGGFWTLALDGQTYYDIASTGVAHGIGSISETMPSPFYLRSLAMWMWIFGVSPASALLLNVASYGATAILIVIAADIRKQQSFEQMRGAVIAFVAFTFSPALLIFSTQPVKDAFFVMLLIGSIVGARIWWKYLYESESWRRSTGMAAGGALLAAGIYAISGIRAYVAFFMIGAFVVSAAHAIWSAAGFKWRVVQASLHAALLVVLWLSFVVGAGAYAATYEAFLYPSRSSPSAVATLDSARAGFAASGGATTLEETRGMDYGGAGVRSQNHVIRAARGLAALVIPISVLSAASIVHFAGGQGLLFITDLDTIFIDATVLASLWLLVLALRRQPLSTPALFVLLLGLSMAASMAYVVTNFGTLFRLRLIAFAPLWMLPLMIVRLPNLPNRSRPSSLPQVES